MDFWFLCIFQFWIWLRNWQFCGSVSTLPVLAVFIIKYWFHRDIEIFSIFYIPVLWPEKFGEPSMYLCWMWGTGSTILSKIPMSGKYHIAKIAIWYYRGGSCSSVYWDLGINRKMGLGNPQQDENLMREYCDERQYC